MPDQQALVLSAKQGPLVLQTKDVPSAGPGELLMKVHATGVNPLDWKIQKFGMIVEKYPSVLGVDAAGTVEAIGEGVQGFKKGDRIACQAWMGLESGSYQQYTIVPAALSAKLPDALSYDEASALPTGICTASIGLYNQEGGSIGLAAPWDEDGKTKYAGQPFFVNAGATSVGQYAIQFAKMSGFSPIITTASLSNKQLLTSFGATHVLDRQLSPAQITSEASKVAGAPIKYAFDAIGTLATVQTTYDILSDGARFAAPVAGPSPPQIKTVEGKKVEPFYVQGLARMPQNSKLEQAVFLRLGKFVNDGTIKPNRVEVLPGGLTGIPDGLERLFQNKVDSPVYTLCTISQNAAQGSGLTVFSYNFVRVFITMRRVEHFRVCAHAMPLWQMAFATLDEYS